MATTRRLAGSLAAMPIAASIVATAQTPQVLDVTIARNIGFGRPVEAATTFEPKAGPLFVWFRYEQMSPRTNITVTCTADAAAPGRAIARVTVATGDEAAGAAYAGCDPPAGTSWTEGVYRAEIVVSGVTLATTRFSIAGRTERRAAASEPSAPKPEPAPRPVPASFTHPKLGYQFEPPAGWSVDAAVETADVRLRAADDSGLIEIGSGRVSARLDPISYAAGWESLAVGPAARLKSKQAGHPSIVSGAVAYEGIYAADGVYVKVVFAGFGDRFFVFTGVFPREGFARGEALFDRFIAGFKPAGENTTR